MLIFGLVIRRGSEDKVGKPVKESEHIGIKVTAVDKIDPKYLFYLMEYVYMKGYYKPLIQRDIKFKKY
jgi:hypothetical protein